MLSVYKYLICCVLVIFGLDIFYFVARKLNPQVDMALQSQCKDPLRTWNGKYLGITLWYNSFQNRPADFSIHKNIDTNSSDRRRRLLLDINDYNDLLHSPYSWEFITSQRYVANNNNNRNKIANYLYSDDDDDAIEDYSIHISAASVSSSLSLLSSEHIILYFVSLTKSSSEYYEYCLHRLFNVWMMMTMLWLQQRQHSSQVSQAIVEHDYTNQFLNNNSQQIDSDDSNRISIDITSAITRVTTRNHHLKGSNNNITINSNAVITGVNITTENISRRIAAATYNYFHSSSSSNPAARQRNDDINNNHHHHHSQQQRRPVVMWGSHHKTGTILANKIFSIVCSRLNWCCLFHVTRDSVQAVKHTIVSEGSNLDVLGHCQWIWYPEEIVSSPYTVDIVNNHYHKLHPQEDASSTSTDTSSDSIHAKTNSDNNDNAGRRGGGGDRIDSRSMREEYRFVHFYRDPMRKIISGYRYHRDGIEPWSRSIKRYHHTCYHQNFTSSSSTPSSSSSIIDNSRRKAAQQQHRHHYRQEQRHTHRHDQHNHDYDSSDSNDGNKIMMTRQQVVAHCRSVHLCETCCRREHEIQAMTSSSSSTSRMHRQQQSHDRSNSISNDYDGDKTATQYKPQQQQYAVRDTSEYEFLCQHLGQKVRADESLSDALLRMSETEGLLAEAALDYYETQRMARIVNHTWHDPYSLNIDIDDLFDDFDTQVRRILHHILPYPQSHSSPLDSSSGSSSREAALTVRQELIESLVDELSFFDLTESPFYKLAISGFMGHVDTSRSSTGTSSTSDSNAKRTSDGNSAVSTSSSDGVKMVGGETAMTDSPSSTSSGTTSATTATTDRRSTQQQFLDQHQGVQKLYSESLELMSAALSLGSQLNGRNNKSNPGGNQEKERK